MTGALLALITIVVTSFVASPYLDGVTTILMGVLMAIAEADDIKFDIRNLVIRDPDIADVTFGILRMMISKLGLLVNRSVQL